MEFLTWRWPRITGSRKINLVNLSSNWHAHSGLRPYSSPSVGYSLEGVFRDALHTLVGLPFSFTFGGMNTVSSQILGFLKGTHGCLDLPAASSSPST